MVAVMTAGLWDLPKTLWVKYLQGTRTIVYFCSCDVIFSISIGPHVIFWKDTVYYKSLVVLDIRLLHISASRSLWQPSGPPSLVPLIQTELLPGSVLCATCCEYREPCAWPQTAHSPGKNTEWANHWPNIILIIEIFPADHAEISTSRQLWLMILLT